jgi:hypothetical protein
MTTDVDPTEPTTQTSELPSEVFEELLVEANATEHESLFLFKLARLAYAAGAKAGAKGEYQRGADAELEACCEWLERDPYGLLTQASRGAIAGILRSTARRPKPPSLKEQALADLYNILPDTDGPGPIDWRPYERLERFIRSLPDPQ